MHVYPGLAVSTKKYLIRKLTKVQRLAGLMISSGFPGAPTIALEILLNITPIEEFLLAEAVRGLYRIAVQCKWTLACQSSWFIWEIEKPC